MSDDKVPFETTAASRKISMIEDLLVKEKHDHQALVGYLADEQARAQQLASELKLLCDQIVADNIAAIQAINAQVSQSMQILVDDAMNRAQRLEDEKKRIAE